jgi:hypothetical protein
MTNAAVVAAVMRRPQTAGGAQCAPMARPSSPGGPCVHRAPDRPAYRPRAPASWSRKPYQWLSNVDIDRVMAQYDGLRGFAWLGAVARDWYARDGGARIYLRACQAAGLEKWPQGAPRPRSVGAVLNLDAHDRPGSHWVAVFVGVDAADPRRFGAWYYDSAGRPPVADARRLCALVRDALAGGPPAPRGFGMAYNTRRAQIHNTECGVYACLFLIACITTRRSFADICGRLMPDDEGAKGVRYTLFRAPPAPAPLATRSVPAPLATRSVPAPLATRPATPAAPRTALTSAARGPR